ncbi:hypothetical protein PMG11_00920 [Penicillium brasilianum]|uniref:Uncharacterized protein n=1 Tax=Penicillium brasilianum TaxID=104259 RepID=A0A0F7TFD8_PENBI|nr:hypothetical protein PMG11_00920 [Penicillium brasilianum]
MAHLLANRDPEAFNSLMRTSDRQDEDSLPKLVKMAWNIGILDRESQSAANALRCAVGLKEMSVISLLLEYGVPPRLFERRKDWLDLMNDETGIFIELAEMKNPQLDQRGTKIYKLGPVDIAESDLLRSMRFYRSCKIWEDQDPLANNKYGKSKVTPGGQVFYSSTLSSGQIPKSDDAFILELISDMDFEWSLILTNVEERFSASLATQNINRSDLINYLISEGNFFAAVRQALHQQVKIIFEFIDQYLDERRNSILMSDEGDPENCHLEIKPAARLFEQTIGDKLEKLRTL